MDKIRYMISDAANMVNVESHVLRYWEEELKLDIPRNEMGHRYYTQENIQEFQKIKELKELGYQLKAIRMIVHNGSLNPQLTELVVTPKGMPKVLVDSDERMMQFRELMTEIVEKALEANNEKLSKNISEDVGEQVIKEMNYLFREQEEAEEERFRHLDEAIRTNLKKTSSVKQKFWQKKPSQA